MAAPQGVRSPTYRQQNRLAGTGTHPVQFPNMPSGMPGRLAEARSAAAGRPWMQENPIQFPTMPSGMSGRLAEARSAAGSRGGYGSKPGSGSDTYGTKPPKGGMSEAEAAHLALLGGSGSPFARDLAQQRQERQEAGILPGEDGGKPAKAAQAYTGLRDDLEAAYDAAVGKPAKGGGFGATVSAPGTTVSAPGTSVSTDRMATYPGPTPTGGPSGGGFGSPVSATTDPSGFAGVGAVGGGGTMGGTQAGFGVGGTMNAGNPYSADPVQNQFSVNVPPVGGAFGGAQGMAGGNVGLGGFAPSRGGTQSGLPLGWAGLGAGLFPFSDVPVGGGPGKGWV